jgi:uncharacterized protein
MRAGAFVAAGAALGLCLGVVAWAQTPDPMTAPPPPGYYVFQKVVYQNDGGLPDDRTYFGMLLHNLAAHIEATGGRVEIRVVNFSRGVSLFQMARTDPELASQIDSLRAKGVRFLVCRNTLRAMKLRPEDLYKVAPTDVVPSGVAEIARLQGQGFVYIRP